MDSSSTLDPLSRASRHDVPPDNASDDGMVHHMHDAAPRDPDALLDTRGCATYIGISLSLFEKLAAHRAWERGDLPVPVYVGRNSGKRDRYGRPGGMRRWRPRDVEAWLESHKGYAP